jgi:hypothetical protein
MSESKFQLSVVVTSRNDNHGKNLLRRMQLFINGLTEQSNKFNIYTELLIIEWNPPSNTETLIKALDWSIVNSSLFCTVKIITVPKKLHEMLEHSRKMELFQMIAKNVGIRRASGNYILVTNVDILFSDNIFKKIQSGITPQTVYRVDRIDVTENVLNANSFRESLQMCPQSAIRINTLGKIIILLSNKPSLIDNLLLKIPIIFRPILLAIISAKSKLFVTKSFDSMSKKNNVSTSFFNAKNILKKISRLPERYLHLNAAGDFTLMDKKSWIYLRGYPEWAIFSMHLDSVLLHQAINNGLRQVNLGLSCPIYHVEHDSGWVPELNDALYAKLDMKSIPYINSCHFEKIIEDQRKNALLKKITSYNRDDWGMANENLSTITIN